MRSLLSPGHAPGRSVAENKLAGRGGRGRRPRGSTSVRGLILASLCALAGGLLLAGAPAQAAVTHNYLSRIAKEVPSQGPKGEPVAAPGPLDAATGLTVDSGELYVADGFYNSRLDKFNASSGAFVSQFPQIPPPVYDVRQSVAVGHKTGEKETYVTGDESGSNTVGLVAVYGPTGTLQALWKGADTPNKGFACFECGPRGVVAVDNSTSLAEGDVYVSDPRGLVDIFKPEAGGGEKYVTQLTGPETGVLFNGVDSIAVSQFNGDLLVLENNAVDVFEPTVFNEYVLVRRLTGTPAGSFKLPNGIAVDGGNGNIYIAEADGEVIDQFDSEGAYLGHMTGVGTPAGVFGGVSSLAVDPATHDVYVGDREKRSFFVDVFGPSLVIPDVATEPASNVKARSATLNGAVNPHNAGSATCQFVWGTSTSYGNVAPCPVAIPEGGANVPVSVTLSGLQPDTTYHYRLQAGNGNGTNPGEAFQDREFTTPGPGIHSESASVVTAGSVSLGAGIDPNNVSTTYYFQYGTTAAYGANVPAPPGLELGSGKGDLNVSVHLQGLQAATTYHYHVVALSEPNGEAVTAEGPDETFTTQAVGSEFTQADGRSWEMVSPPNKQGAAIIAVGNEQGSDIQAGADGSGITYTATASFVPNPAGNRAIETTQVISTRHAPSEWETADITTPHYEGAEGVAVGHSSEYKLFSNDLSLGLVEPEAGHTPLPPLPPGAEKTTYLRKADGGYEALVTSGNVLPGAKFGSGGAQTEFESATPDFSHVVLHSSEVALTAGGPVSGLYEWAGGQLQPASISVAENPVDGSLGAGDYVVRHAISDDGSRIFFGAGNNHLYLRDMARKETVQVDAAQGAPEPTGASSIYRTASSDGSRVFFLSRERLTANSMISSEGSYEDDLYEFELTSGKGEPLAGKLTDLTAAKNAEESAGIKGVIGASEDGSYVYFVAAGVLGNAAEHGAKSGSNLYVEHYDATTKAWMAPVFIAALSGEDRPDWEEYGGHGSGGMTARVSPNGLYLAFMSEQSLTGYENRDANGGSPDEEVFLYHANTDNLACISCNPTGGRPAGLHESNTYEGNLVDYALNWGERWVAGSVPGWTTTDLSHSLYQSRYLSDSGRLFFNSSDALVPTDVNGKEDVYEYEPSGVGSCQPPGYGQSASDLYVESIGGCVALISAGTSSDESAFMDASETGSDVFFLTTSHLAQQDYDTSLDLYNAHECTASSPCAPAPPLAPPPCTTGDACKPAPTPQPALFGAPSSATFSGAGNIVPSTSKSGVTQRQSTQAKKLVKALKACKKKSKRKRAACERQARKKYGAKKSRVAKSLSSGTRR